MVNFHNHLDVTYVNFFGELLASPMC